MITRDEVKTALRATCPAVTDHEVERYFATIEHAQEQRRNAKFRWLRDRHLEGNIRWPDGMELQDVFDKVKDHVEVQVRADYLDELAMMDTENERMSEDEVLDLQQDVLKETPGAWATHWREMWVPTDLNDLAHALWPDEARTPATEDLYNLATALFTSMEHRGVALPEGPEDPRASELQRQIHDALLDQYNQHRHQQ